MSLRVPSSIADVVTVVVVLCQIIVDCEAEVTVSHFLMKAEFDDSYISFVSAFHDVPSPPFCS